MSTSTFTVENTLVDSLTEAFWKDFIKNRKKFQMDMDWVRNIQELKDEAFNPDHSEWIGSWMWEEEGDRLLKKHKANGVVIFDGEGRLYGIKYVDGVKQTGSIDIKVELT
jgi:hypothetical protein